jgi:hypothetical protein
MDGYRCLCPSPSYQGVHCEIQINQCSSNPCLHGGTCLDRKGDFTCLCPPWFSGKTCAERIDPCIDRTLCANNGTCLADPQIRPFGHTCQCRPGFTGHMCEVNVDDCVSQPCARGQCLDRINGFICQCYSGYTGVLCDVSRTTSPMHRTYLAHRRFSWINVVMSRVKMEASAVH